MKNILKKKDANVEEFCHYDIDPKMIVDGIAIMVKDDVINGAQKLGNGAKKLGKFFVDCKNGLKDSITSGTDKYYGHGK
jgi:hypothetical protein